MPPKRHHVLLFLLILVIILALFYFLFPLKTIAPENGSQTASTTPAGPTFTYTSKTIHEDSSQKAYSIKAIYPVFSLSNGAIEKKINDAVALFVNNEIGNYKSSSEADTFGAGEPAGNYGTSTFEIGAMVTTNQKLTSILPIKFDENVYNAGAAHPGETILTSNYNLTTGNQIGLVDLFKPGSNYLGRISKYSIQTLKSKLDSDTDSQQLQSGAGPDEKNFAAFLITDKGLTIIFNEYQVAAYAAGSQEITIPWSNLQDILNPNLGI